MLKVLYDRLILILELTRYATLFCRNIWWVENSKISYQRSVGTLGANPVP
jgi:hypothetical protein